MGINLLGWKVAGRSVVSTSCTASVEAENEAAVDMNADADNHTVTNELDAMNTCIP